MQTGSTKEEETGSACAPTRVRLGLREEEELEVVQGGKMSTAAAFKLNTER